MALKTDVSDYQRDLHELAVDLEAALSDVACITTEEARCDSNLDGHIKDAKRINNEIRCKFKYLENAIVRLRTFL